MINSYNHSNFITLFKSNNLINYSFKDVIFKISFYKSNIDSKS